MLSNTLCLEMKNPPLHFTSPKPARKNHKLNLFSVKLIIFRLETETTCSLFNQRKNENIHKSVTLKLHANSTGRLHLEAKCYRVSGRC